MAADGGAAAVVPLVGSYRFQLSSKLIWSAETIQKRVADAIAENAVQNLYLYCLEVRLLKDGEALTPKNLAALDKQVTKEAIQKQQTSMKLEREEDRKRKREEAAAARAENKKQHTQIRELIAERPHQKEAEAGRRRRRDF